MIPLYSFSQELLLNITGSINEGEILNLHMERVYHKIFPQSAPKVSLTTIFRLKYLHHNEIFYVVRTFQRSSVIKYNLKLLRKDGYIGLLFGDRR